MSLSSTSLPKPKNWQDFENKVHQLFECLLGDPATQQNGRSGQKQNGVDVYGYRHEEHLVGVQCKKKSEKPVTEKELRREVKKALGFTPSISEFILVTTAPRDAKIQEVARSLTRELSTSATPIRVAVWGWDDIEDEAAKYDTAWKAFDPTWNPFVEAGFRTLEVRIGDLSKSLKESAASSNSRVPGVPSRLKHAFALPDNMPQLGPYFGRKPQLKEILSVLTKAPKTDASSETAICIYGMAGIGKTALATKAVADLRSRRSSYTMAVWESLRLDPISNTPQSFHKFVDSLITKLSGGTAITSQSEYDCLQKTDIVLKILNEIHAVVVIDNVESILTASSADNTGYFSPQHHDYRHFLTTVVRDCLNSRLIVTSRERIIELPALKCHTVELGGLHGDASVELLKQYQLSSTQRELLKLSMAYDGHPKLLELVASLIVEDPVYKGNVAAFLKNRSRLLTLDIEKLAYETILRLSNEEKECFARISVYNPDEYPITLESIQALSTDVPSYSLKEVLVRSLCRRGLLSYSPPQQSYLYHPVVHEFAFKLLSADANRLRDTYRRAYSFFMSLPVKESSQWQRFGDIHELLLAFKYICKAGDLATAGGIVCGESVRRSLVKWGRYRDIIEIYSQLLPAPRNKEPVVAAKKSDLVVAYNLLGVAYRNIGDIDASVCCYRKSLDLAGEIKDTFWQTVVLGNLAYVFNEAEKYGDAIESALKALELANVIDDKRAQSYALGNLGVSFRNSGRLEEAIEYLQKDIKVCNRIDNVEGESTAFFELAMVYRQRGDYNEAVDAIKRALILNRSLNNPNRELEFVLLLCDLFMLLDDLASACISILKAKEVANDVSSEKLVSMYNLSYDNISKRVDPFVVLCQGDDLGAEFYKILTT
ncbi:MAG: tetratricopeptide repeat protein [Thermodesulfobacteriota bacterium]